MAKTQSRIIRGSLQALLLALFLLACQPGSAAHTVFESLTRIDHNTRAGTLEVIHNITAHDLEAVLSRDMGRKVSFLDADVRQEMVERTKRLVEQAFALRADGIAVALETIGMEDEGDTIVVYQEAPIGARPARVAVTDRLFLDAFPGQKNTVVLKFGDFVDSLTMVADQPSGEIAIAPAGQMENNP